MKVPCMFSRTVLRCPIPTARVRNKDGLDNEAEAKLPANDKNRRQIRCRCLLVEALHMILRLLWPALF